MEQNNELAIKMNYIKKYIDNGWGLIPVTKSKRNRPNTGKQPITLPGRGNYPVRDMETAEKYWSNDKGYNVGIMTGKVSKLVVLEVDEPDVFDKILEKYPEFRKTYIVKINNIQQYHYYFRIDGYTPHNYKKRPTGWGCLYSTGKLVVAPPSIHYTGGVYEVVNDVEPLPFKAEYMDDLLLLLRTGKQEKTVASKEKLVVEEDDILFADYCKIQEDSGDETPFDIEPDMHGHGPSQIKENDPVLENSQSQSQECNITQEDIPMNATETIPVVSPEQGAVPTTAREDASVNTETDNTMKEQKTVTRRKGIYKRSTQEPLEFHPAAELYPMMNKEELTNLKDSIQQHGQRYPVVLCDEKIVDGRNRFLACKELGIEVDCWDLPEDRDPWEYAMDCNMNRRNITKSQKAAIAVKYMDNFPPVPKGTRTNEWAAQLSGVSYYGLLAFDFSIFTLTNLPILIHDSPLFKNIENPISAKLFELYTTFAKQSFIAVDEITKYGKEIELLLSQNAVVTLSKDHYLFGYAWSNKENSNAE